MQRVDAAERNAGAFQIASPNPIFALRDPGAGGASEKPKGLCALVLVGKPQTVPQRRRR